MTFHDGWNEEEPTMIERSTSWLVANFAEFPTYQAPPRGLYDTNDVTAELPCVGGDQ